MMLRTLIPLLKESSFRRSGATIALKTPSLAALLGD
jgi:hypothetical protein